MLEALCSIGFVVEFFSSCVVVRIVIPIIICICCIVLIVYLVVQSNKSHGTVIVQVLSVSLVAPLFRRPVLTLVLAATASVSATTGHGRAAAR